jgi:hypothetical protein
MWKGQTTYIIGGGTSLRAFDFSPLRHENVIGCNDAYLLGSWVNICYFGDKEWYDIHSTHPEFVAFPGLKVSCTPFPISGVMSLERDLNDMLYLEGTKIGWFGNTGASAVNLAIRLGCLKIVLLGFDMMLGTDGQANWHPNLVNAPTDQVYANFKTQFKLLASLIDKKCPDVVVLNANPDSGLECFPKMRFDEAMKI